MRTVAQRRLIAQHATSPSLRTPGQVAEHLLAVQAQDLAAAMWALGLRMRQRNVERVERAIDRGEVLRTWPMRGTLHFVSPRDARWLVELLAPRAVRRSAGRRRELGLDEATLAKARRILARALSGKVALARQDAYAALERGGIPTRGQRGIHVLQHLAQEGVLCLGPREGKQPTFALLDEWARGGREAGSREEALREVATRYATSHGPVAAGDFAWWTGLGLTDAREALASASGALVEEEIGGSAHWRARRERGVSERAPAARLLPAFDEAVVAYKDRSAALLRARSSANPQAGLLSPCIVVDGQIVGTWGRRVEKDRVRVSLKAFDAWSTTESDAIEAATEEYGAFLGLPVEFVISRQR